MKPIKALLAPLAFSLIFTACGADILPLSEAVTLDDDTLSQKLSGYTLEEISDVWGEPGVGCGDIYSYDDMGIAVFSDPKGYAGGAKICSWFEGRYLRDKGGDMVLVEHNGYIEPTSVAAYDLTSFAGFDFAEFESGDRIKILVDGIRETYPAQATVYATELMEKGSYDDLDGDVMAQLREMGWVG